jgi:hypothetical protein
MIQTAINSLRVAIVVGKSIILYCQSMEGTSFRSNNMVDKICMIIMLAVVHVKSFDVGTISKFTMDFAERHGLQRLVYHLDNPVVKTQLKNQYK